MKGIKKVFTVVTFTAILFPFSFEGFSEEKIEELKRRLDEVETDIQKARAELMEINGKYFRFQNQLVYSNETSRSLWNEIAQLEKQIIEKKNKLREILNEIPEFKRVEEERKQIYERISKLNDERLLLKQMIESAEYKIKFSERKE